MSPGFVVRAWPQLALLGALLSAWEAAIRLLQVSEIVVPAPSAVAVAMWDGFGTGEFAHHLGVTFVEVLAGYVLGALAGLVLGFGIGQSARLERLLYPYVVAFQTVPKVAIAPLIVIWCGYGIGSKIVITATITFFPVVANTIVGLKTAPRDQLEMLAAFTASRWQMFRMVRLPHALPYVFAGLDIAIVLAVIGAIVGEFVGAQAGLGYLILQKNYQFDMASVFAILLLLSAMGVGLHMVVQAVSRRVVFWTAQPTHGVTAA